ncbi:MAG: hypothetical protein ACPLPT_08015 [Moorellales bacterium]
MLLRAIAKALNVTEEWLETGRGPMRVPPGLAVAEALRPYPHREKVRALLEGLEALVGDIRDLQLRETVAEIKSQSSSALDDLELHQMVAWLIETYKKADPRTRTWLAVQFERAFPDFKEDLLRQQDEPGERPEAAATGDIG